METMFQDLQEAYLIIFSSVLVWWLIVLLAGCLLSAIGVIFLELASRMTR